MSSLREIRIAGVVVLYNPPPEVIVNINTYLNKLEKLFVIDNSDRSSEQYIVTRNQIIALPDVVYISNEGNKGIAQALNSGARRAIGDHFDFLLTMDQDSAFSISAISSLLTTPSRFSLDTVGIIAPFHFNRPHVANEPEFQEVEVTMTSGNLLNLKAFGQVGDFREDFFIDYVDHEYCLRLRKQRYKIIQFNTVEIFHKLGNIKKVKWLGVMIGSSNHDPIRRYYITRNRLSVIKEYLLFDPFFCFRSLVAEIEEFTKIVLMEEAKLAKIKYSLFGLRDFLLGRFGKYE